MWFIGFEVKQETSAPTPSKNPGSALSLKAGPDSFRFALPAGMLFTK